MKLLTPQANKDATAQDQVRDLMRTQELQKAAKDARIGLAKAEADFNATLAHNRDQWAQEELQHETRIKEMTTEVVSLEKRQELALIPVKQREAEADKRWEEANAYELKLKDREAEVEDRAEYLEDKLDKVGQQEQDVILANQRLELKKQGILEQAEQTREGIKRLNQLTIDFQNFSSKAEIDIRERKSALFLWDRSLQAREDKQKRIIAKLNIATAKLADDRLALQAAWDELKAKLPPGGN